MKKRSSYYSYWFDEEMYDMSATHTMEIREILKLSAFMRSCKNFVRILTGKNIPIVYAGDNSYTNGTAIVLSADIKDNFDSTVGLALHEGSHILLTDFDIIDKLVNESAFRDIFITADMIKKVLNSCDLDVRESLPEEIDKLLLDNAAKRTDDEYYVEKALLHSLKDIMNWIEDRRIDKFVIENAPGYSGYYDALYQKYFYSDVITVQLATNVLYKNESLDSYMFRIINLLNSASDINALNGLAEIEKIIDVKHIDRLKSTKDSLKVASDVLDVIVNNITEIKFGDKREFIRQRNFINNNITKTKLSARDIDKLQKMADDVSLYTAGGEEFGGMEVEVIVVNNVNDRIVNNREFEEAFAFDGKDRNATIDNGLIMGKLLGHKLKPRGEEKELKHTRQLIGKIDGRLVNQLAYENLNVFFKKQISTYKKIHLHISIDISGSMAGDRLEQALKTTIAIAVACKMSNNIDCVISLRTTTYAGIPVVYVVYDNRVNTLQHLRKYFAKISATGVTPESLCYQPLMKKIFPKKNMNEKFYFVNMSDGAPYFVGTSSQGNIISYEGTAAEVHCRRMINKMISDHGAAVISYYIEESDDSNFLNTFKGMYGKDATRINMNDVSKIAVSLNGKFLEND